MKTYFKDVTIITNFQDKVFLSILCSIGLFHILKVTIGILSNAIFRRLVEHWESYDLRGNIISSRVTEGIRAAVISLLKLFSYTLGFEIRNDNGKCRNDINGFIVSSRWLLWSLYRRMFSYCHRIYATHISAARMGNGTSKVVAKVRRQVVGVEYAAATNKTT